MQAPVLRQCLILRGLPGSGKSSYAAQVQAQYGSACEIFSADNYRMKNGRYVFVMSKNKECHDRCYADFCAAVQRGVTLIIVDNTNIQAWEYQRYGEFAVAAGYNTSVSTIGGFTAEEVQLYAQRNIHNVPLDAIRRMAERASS